MPQWDLVILGYSEAGMYMRGPSSAQVSAILSIHGKREFGVEGAEVRRRLGLTFDDVEVPVTGDVVSMQRAMARRHWSQQNGLHEMPPTAADAEAIVKFACETQDIGGTLLCHCNGGMSRAPAAALICLA